MSIMDDKKSNMAYWDAIDNLTEEYVAKMLEASVPPIAVDDNTLLDLGKEVTDFVIEHLEKNANANFPYVEGDY